MNIKLDKDIRIRLNQDDIKVWNAEKYLEQKFKLGLRKFTLKIELDSSASRSYLVNEQEGLVVVLSDEDAALLGDGVRDEFLLKSGIVVDDITLQIDKWSTDTRKKYEDINKRQR